MDDKEKLNPAGVRTMIRCSPLLPAPGPEVVKELGEAWLEQNAELLCLKETMREFLRLANYDNEICEPCKDRLVELVRLAEAAVNKVQGSKMTKV